METPRRCRKFDQSNKDTRLMSLTSLCCLYCWRHSGVLIFNFAQISHSSVISIVNFEQLNHGKASLMSDRCFHHILKLAYWSALQVSWLARCDVNSSRKWDKTIFWFYAQLYHQLLCGTSRLKTSVKKIILITFRRKKLVARALFLSF